MTTSVLHVTEQYYEVEKYITCTDAVPNVHVPIVNGSWYEALPDDLKKYLMHAWMSIWTKSEAWRKKHRRTHCLNWRKNGMTVTVLTDDQKQEWIDATSGILDEYKDQAGKKSLTVPWRFLEDSEGKV